MQGTKTKNITFKNPFDLDVTDQQDVTNANKNYQLQHTNVINPLPFNPYATQQLESQKSKKKTSGKQSSSITSSKGNNRQILSQQFQKQLTTNQLYSQTQQQLKQPTQLDDNGDPPLLLDIGIDPNMIRKRVLMVLKMSKPDQQAIEESDLSGPILIAMCFGILLLLAGKVQFGDVYAIFVVGNFMLYLLFNLMSQVETISLYNIMSAMGYSMIPMLILGLVGIFISMKGPIGIGVSLGVSGWSSFAASTFIEGLMKQTESNRKILLLYPLFLFYVSFAMIIIF